MATAVITFGRMNPPTVGHEKLVDKVKAEARGGPAFVYLSHSQNSSKDPLSYNDKVKYATRAFGRMVKRSTARTIIEVMKELENKYSAVKLVVGSDRVTEFKTLLNKYNGKDYNFDKIEVVSAGERDPDSEGVSGMSASKMRDAVKNNEFATFRLGLPKKLKSSDLEIFKKVQQGMGIKESIEEAIDATPKGRPFTFNIEEKDIDDEELEKIAKVMDDEDMEDLGVDMAKFVMDMDDDEDDEEEIDEDRKPLSIMQRRKMAMRMKRLAPRMARFRKMRKKRMATKDRLVFRARKKAVQLLRKRVAGKKGENYNKLSPAEKIGVDRMIMKKRPMVAKLARRLLPKVKKAEMERLKQARNTTKESFEVFLERAAQDPDINKRAGTQPAKYHRGLSPATKAKRDAQFKKQARMSDKNPAAYKPAPGDATAKTKPSKYTKAYHDMFGEETYKGVDIGNWKYEGPRDFAKKLIDKFGKPDHVEMNPETGEAGSVLFNNIDGFDFVRVVDSNTNKLHPYPAKIYVEGGLYFKVPREMVGKLKEASPTIIIDELNGFVIGKCASLAIAAGTIQFVIDAVNGDSPPTRAEYDKRMRSIIDDNKYDPEISWWENSMNEDVKGTKERHKREKEQQKRERDRELDAARLRDIRAKNRMSEAKRGRPKKGESEEEGIEHIQVQLRKVINLRGMKTVEFTNGKKGKLTPGMAQKVLDIIDKTRDAKKKQQIVKYIQKSQDNLMSVAQGKEIKKADKFAIPLKSLGAQTDYVGTARVSGIVGSMHEGLDINQSFEAAIEKGKDIDTFFESYLAEKNIKSYKNHSTSSIAPRDNYLLEKDMAGLRKKAEKSGISYGTLKKVYNRGVAAWKTGHRPGTTPSQWGYARVNAFITKKKKGGLNHDTDLAHYEDIRGELMNEEPLEIGTDKIRKKYQEDTPGETGKIKLAVDYVKKPEIAPTAKEEARVINPKRMSAYQKFAKAHKVDHDSIRMAHDNPNHPESKRMMKNKHFANALGMYKAANESTDLDKKINEDFEDFLNVVMVDEQINLEDSEACCDDCADNFDHVITEAEYQGKSVKLNDPIRTSENPNKKFKVYVKNGEGNVVVVRFGDPNLSIKRDDPDRRRSFRARHKCDNPGPKWKARYWSCYQWRASAKVDN